MCVSVWARAGWARAVTLAVVGVWYQTVYVLPKLEYNQLHPYTSWIPITAWAVLRNLTPGAPLSLPGLRPAQCT